jgi:hypothetical protein
MSKEKPVKDVQKTAFGGTKSPSVGYELSPADLAVINTFALSDQKAEDLYSRKVLLCHNGIDRDRDRFPDELLEDFARTAPGKSFLWGHVRRDFTPYGLWFKAETEVISPEKFKELTGETPRLPEGQENIKVMWAWFYVVKADNESLIANIEAGTYRHFSIGFDAKDFNPVRDEFDRLLYWEYKAPGEMLEGSLVWLGAQPGATAQKSYKDDYIKNHKQPKEDTMTINLKDLGGVLGKQLDSEDLVVSSVKTALAEKDETIRTLTDEKATLQKDADVGRHYRQKQVDEYCRLKGILGEREDTEEAATKTKGYAKSMGIEFLDSEVVALQKRVEEKFPNGAQLDGEDTDKRTSGKGKNPLIPEENKEA